MGRSIRSKIGKRLRTAKRQRVDCMVLTPKLQEHSEQLRRVVEGRAVVLKKPKNAFKYPDAEGAAFPQHEILKPIDFRASNLPMASYAFRGNRRKYTGEELEYMQSLAKHAHPKTEVLAGGGAILAKTGKKVSMHQAEIIATAAVNPEAAAIAMAGPSTASSAVADAVAEEDADMDDEDGSEEGEQAADPTDAADHTRRPVLKDARRANKAAAHRPRAKAVKSKRANPAA